MYTQSQQKVYSLYAVKTQILSLFKQQRVENQCFHFSVGAKSQKNRFKGCI
jgi:hypothetical protein